MHQQSVVQEIQGWLSRAETDMDKEQVADIRQLLSMSQRVLDVVERQDSALLAVAAKLKGGCKKPKDKLTRAKSQANGLQPGPGGVPTPKAKPSSAYAKARSRVVSPVASLIVVQHLVVSPCTHP